MEILHIDISGVTTVAFKEFNKYIWIRNKTSNPVYVSLTSNVGEGVAGTTEILGRESGMILMSDSKIIYITGSGSVEIKASDFSTCPFKTAAEGGGDADITKQYISDQIEMSPYETVTLPDSQANAMTLAYDAELYIANIGANSSPFTALFFSEDSGTTWKECLLTTGSGIMSISCTLKLRKGDMLWERKVGEYPGNAYIAYYRKRDYSLR